MIKNTNRKMIAATASAALVASAVVPTALFAEETNVSFPDVDADHVAASQVEDLYQAGIITGYEDGTFQPGKSVTRAEVSNMVTHILGLPTDVSSTDFSDVKDNAWYTDSVNALYAAGHIKGFKDGTFAPNGELTRAEFAKIIVKAYDIPAKSADLPFEDVKTNAWYTDDIETLYAHGLISGQTVSTFGPSDSIKRIDLAMLLANTDYMFGDKLPKPGEDDEEVAELEVESVSALDDIIVEFGGEYDLPTDVEVTLSDDKVVSVPVNWEDTVDVDVAGTYELEGALDLSDMDNVAETELNATVNVVVEEEVVAEVDKSALDNKIDEVNSDFYFEDYTTESWDAVIAARNAAQEVYQDENATQAEIDQAAEDLQAALDNLVKIEGAEADKPELEAKVDEVYDLYFGDYTAESWNLLVAERNKAQAVIDNEDATQAEITEALDKLENALGDLVTNEAGEAQADFLADLETKVENIGAVAEVDLDGEAIDVKFASDVSPQDVKNAAKGLVTALGNDINSGALTIGGNEFNLTDDKVVTRSATAILKGVSPVDFLTSGTLVNSGYTATITDNEDVEFDLAGTLKFTATNK